MIEGAPMMATSSEIGLSERSMKFYDGTYSLVADGFTDEHGVYRAFDCYDPAARAPTPLPPGLTDDWGVSKVSAHRLRDQSRTSAVARTPIVDQQAALSLSTRPIEGSSNKRGGVRFASSSSGGNLIMIPREDLLRGYKDGEYLLGKLEGIQLANRRIGVELSQAECYNLCGIAYSEEAQSTPTKPENIEETTSNVTDKVEADDGASPLSDCPSDLSDWEEGKKAENSTKNKISTKPKHVVNGETPTKRTTRGIAQKVSKGAKKSGPLSRQVQIPPERVSLRRQSAR